jgi:peptidoglycan pentaglycine glycine transferase (the first glycine)
MSPEFWNHTISHLPGAHILQTKEWGQLKSILGWHPIYRIWNFESETPLAAAMVLQRSIPNQGFAARLRILYVPKGPLLDWSEHGICETVLNDLQSIAKKQHAIFIKIDPDLPIGYGIPGTPTESSHPTGQLVIGNLRNRGWRESPEQIQFRNSIKIDLEPDLETLLARMKSKTRYNIRLAQKKGVTVRPGTLDDLDVLYRMYAETSLRDGFVVRDREYYIRSWRTFEQAGLAHILIAQVDGELVAGLVLYHFRKTTWYMYGMSRSVHREKMPTHLLQWEAIQYAKEIGCRFSDFWGAPESFSEDDPMWGVFRFKEGFGGQVVRTIGAWDYPTYPSLYWLYTRGLPKLLGIMRKRGREKTRQSLGMS